MCLGLRSCSKASRELPRLWLRSDPGEARHSADHPSSLNAITNSDKHAVLERVGECLRRDDAPSMLLSHRSSGHRIESR